MNPIIKAQWIKALRSGLYKQGHRRLRNENNVCCLGILCDGLEPNQWNIKMDGTFRHGSERAYPHQRVRRVAGLSMFQCRQLAELNDVKKVGFEEIADWIEKNL